MEELLTERQANKTKSIKFFLSAIYIYNKQIHDLLNADKKNQISVSSERQCHEIKELAEFEKVFSKAIKRQIFRTTAQNHQSSRGHTIFELKIENTQIVDGRETTKHSNLKFVDLAGNESIGRNNVKGEALSEGIAINTDLMFFKKCMNNAKRGESKILI